MHSDTTGGRAGNKGHFQVQIASICHLLDGDRGNCSLRPITRVPHAVLLGKKRALRGKQMTLTMLGLSNPPLSFKTAGLRNENGGWPLIIYRRQELKVNHTDNVIYIIYSGLQNCRQRWEKKAIKLSAWCEGGNIRVILALSTLNTSWNALTRAVFVLVLMYFQSGMYRGLV